MPRKQIPLMVRLWSRVDCKSDGCWIWNGPVNKAGYGVVGKGGRSGGMLLTHRVSWEMLRGPIPDGMNVLHRCDSPPCVNPDHLFLGTQADNVADMLAKGRGNAPTGSRHYRAKLNEQMVLSIRQARREGVAYSILAKQYKVAIATIWHVASYHTWRNVP
jgi:hypothetical protein